LYDEVIKQQQALNNEQYFAQIGELRAIYELDKAEIESERRLTALHHQRYVISGLTATAACWR